MPPRTAKKTSPGPGNKRARATRAMTVKMDAHPEESNLKAEEEEEVVELKEAAKIDEEMPTFAMQEKLIEVVENINAEENVSMSSKQDADPKEPVDEYEKDERLDFEDNDPEYDHEEYGGDYDENEIEQDPQEELDGAEEDYEEEDVGEDEEGDVEEELEVAHEELEPEEDDAHVGECHGGMVDTAEEEEHHKLVKERRKRKEFEIFVGGLDKDASENDLRKVFSEVGEVTEVRILMNPQTKKNKGFAFLRFATVAQAKRACTQFKNLTVNGKRCGVTPSQNSDTLFLGNISRTWNKETLKEKLEHYGVANIEDLTLSEDSNVMGMNRGFAFLEFSSRADAMDAFKRLQKRDVVFGVVRPAKVSFADSFIHPGDEIMAQVKTVFVDGLSASWDEDRVKELLKKYGNIERVELARNMPSARRKDFGFVTFDTHDAAVACAKNINNEELCDGDIKAKVRARLSRPLQRGKGKHVARGDFRPLRGSVQGVRSPWSSVPRSIPFRTSRVLKRHPPPAIQRGYKWPVTTRERRLVMNVPLKNRSIAPPSRSFDRRPPAPPFPKGGMKRDYARREEIPPRSRAAMDYNSRVPADRRTSYRDDYSSHGSGYPDMPRGGTTHSSTRAYIDDGYSQRYGRPPPSYSDGCGHAYDSVPGSKRPHADMGDVPSRYGEAGVRNSRTRLDYVAGNSASRYEDSYSDRLGRSNLGYSGIRGSLSCHDSHGLYGARQGMGYNGDSYSGSDVNGMYSSSFGDDYVSRGSNVGSSSYSSLYSGRGLCGSGYMGSGGSGSYY